MKKSRGLIKDSQLKISEITQEKQQLEIKVNDSFAEVLELAKNNDPTFLLRFQEVYPEYCNNLKKIMPDISQNELHFCGMLKLKLSTKDIAISICNSKSHPKQKK
ncbi:MAG: hypothetical protein K0R77_2099 [Chryseobacterium sp.]|jgi:hypothetical protein|uniref:hypothetical protein n=1 Tax=Chryseobacterium sp. TaxID=1871047 RepID=UPI0026309436|nr:hypothetical protein [Chryseobacterium sp.]MDF2552824.1 hypothetical protein [Chryseobacterium sp.]